MPDQVTVFVSPSPQLVCAAKIGPYHYMKINDETSDELYFFKIDDISDVDHLDTGVIQLDTVA